MDGTLMNHDQLQELKELIEFLKENGIAEFTTESGDSKTSIKFASAAAPAFDAASLSALLGASAAQPRAAAPVATTAAASAPAPAAEADPDAGLHIVTSPIVGTFYESASPGSAPFVSPGDQVDAGQVLCIVEAMKLMNEIECDVAGEVVKRLVSNGQPIEYGQKLFAIRPRS
jgi:acetyl-CoA carboxylase biotin carboxyl carrier protein